jgi:glycosyltransferase involved in cell wall biosynthesis
MKIIHLVLGKANPERMNGVNKVVNQMAIQQKKQGYDVSVWGFTNDLAHNYPDRNFETLLFQAYKNLFYVGKDFIKALASLNPSETVFHLHGGFIPTWFTVSKFLKQSGFRFIFTPHGSYNIIARKKNAFRKNMYFRFFEKPLLKKADYIHCLGASEIDGLHSIFPNTKSQLIPYGFESKTDSTSDTHALTHKNQFIVGFCGRLDIYTKGLDIAVEGFFHFLEKNPCSGTFWIIGDSLEKAFLELKVAKMGLQSQVKFFGSVFGEEKEKLLRQMTVFLHPSRNEGLPTAVLEACSLGIPSIVSQETNMAGYIGTNKAGVALAENNSVCIAEALEKLYKKYLSETLTELQENAINMVQTDFAWENVVNRLNDLYETTPCPKTTAL